ncbi:Oligopeptide transporter, OPT superfamily [Dillenia turbinata]|uniref:Oligopeptide transporter, OPT superfamily n=1 Tax=Dillenia turbinata TaxID=194707 RepID=A0AAN8ZAX1_9MAGN
MVIGYMLPGKPLANVTFKTYGYISMAQALTFLADFKLGRYMKIPPKAMFLAQLAGTAIASTVSFLTTGGWFLAPFPVWRLSTSHFKITPFQVQVFGVRLLMTIALWLNALKLRGSRSRDAQSFEIDGLAGYFRTGGPKAARAAVKWARVLAILGAILFHYHYFGEDGVFAWFVLMMMAAGAHEMSPGIYMGPAPASPPSPTTPSPNSALMTSFPAMLLGLAAFIVTYLCT